MAAPGLKRRQILDALVAEMHHDYMSPMSLAAIGRKYRRNRRGVTELFKVRGLFIRPIAYEIKRTTDGRILPAVDLTSAEIDAAIDRCNRIMVPRELKREWREWSTARRREFISRMRARLNLPTKMPAEPFSHGLEAFDYASPRAQAIAARANRGLNSRDWAIHLKVSSVGVIYRDTLYFWALDHSVGTSGAYYAGLWTKETGRPALHHVIWEEQNGRPVPDGFVLYHVDANRNNFAPQNLELKTRNTLCRENQAGALQRRSRRITQLLLERSQNTKGTNDTLLITKLSAGTR